MHWASAIKTQYYGICKVLFFLRAYPRGLFCPNMAGSDKAYAIDCSNQGSHMVLRGSSQLQKIPPRLLLLSLTFLPNGHLKNPYLVDLPVNSAQC